MNRRLSLSVLHISAALLLGVPTLLAVSASSSGVAWAGDLSDTPDDFGTIADWFRSKDAAEW